MHVDMYLTWRYSRLLRRRPRTVVVTANSAPLRLLLDYSASPVWRVWGYLLVPTCWILPGIALLVEFDVDSLHRLLPKIVHSSIRPNREIWSLDLPMTPGISKPPWQRRQWPVYAERSWVLVLHHCYSIHHRPLPWSPSFPFHQCSLWRGLLVEHWKRNKNLYKHCMPLPPMLVRRCLVG